MVAITTGDSGIPASCARSATTALVQVWSSRTSGSEALRSVYTKNVEYSESEEVNGGTRVTPQWTLPASLRSEGWLTTRCSNRLLGWRRILSSGALVGFDEPASCLDRFSSVCFRELRTFRNGIYRLSSGTA